MATPAEVQALTEAHRVAQMRRSALLAALVVKWWQTYVKQDDGASIERWLTMMVPRIVAGHGQSAALSSVFYTQLRRIEAADASAFTPIRPDPLEPDRVRASLIATGPSAAANLLRSYDKMTTDELRRSRVLDFAGPDPVTQRIIEKKVHEKVATQISGAVVRHTANGGRQTLINSALADKTALGWVRVTDEDPCYFCAMLASRGLVYAEDSFDASDARFHGPGDAKVHDHCGCGIKPAWSRDDPYLERAAEFEEMWYEWSTGSSHEAILTFRRGYEGREKPKNARV